MVSREHSTQQEPSRSLVGFPSTPLALGDQLWRCHSRAHGVWWYASTAGRFDLDEGSGTCYLGRDAEAAVREGAGALLATLGWLDAELIADRVVSVVRSPRAGVLADLTSRNAAAFGVTRELCSMTPYSVPRKWARALSSSHDGIEYHSRYTTGNVRSVALFGPAGQADGPDPVTTEPMAAVATRIGIDVRRAPRVPVHRVESPPVAQ